MEHSTGTEGINSGALSGLLTFNKELQYRGSGRINPGATSPEEPSTGQEDLS